MIIKSLTPLLPANVVIELDDGAEHELFVMVHLPSSTVLVPDEKQYKLVKDHYEQFVKLIQTHLVKAPIIRLPEVPEAVMQRIQAAQDHSEKQREMLDRVREGIETEERFPSEEEISKIVEEEVEKSQQEEDSNAL